MTKIAVFMGSLREDSFNKKLAKNLEKLAPEGVTFDYIKIGDLPLYNTDLEADFPAAVQTAKDQVEQADGVLIVTPEYNRSIPGVLKNAIDWISRPWGHNSFVGKPLGITGASTGAIGTAVAQADLRHIVAYLQTKFFSGQELYFGMAADRFDENGDVVEDSRKYIESYIADLVAWIEKEKS
jgi:NAD(P)H-dependent FMN reductase